MSPKNSLFWYQAVSKQAAYMCAFQISLKPDLEGIHLWVDPQPKLPTSSELCPPDEAAGKVDNESWWWDDFLFAAKEPSFNCCVEKKKLLL